MKKWLIVLMCLMIVGCAQTKKEKKESFEGEKTIVKSHYEKGKDYLKEGFDIDAEREFKKAIEENPEDINAHWHLAWLYKKQNYTYMAIEEFKEVIRINPHIIKARYEIGKCYLSRGDYETAKIQFQEILRIKPEEQKAQELLDKADKAIEANKLAKKEIPARPPLTIQQMPPQLIVIGESILPTVKSPTELTFKNEPDGFRGIKWGTDISTLSGMTCAANPFDSNIKFCTRKNDRLQIGKAKLSAIVYQFYKDKFYIVAISTNNPINFDALKDVVFVKFGDGRQPNKYIKRWVWFGDMANIGLEYNESSQTGTLLIFSQKISLQIEEVKKQEAKEGAEKGF